MANRLAEVSASPATAAAGLHYADPSILFVGLEEMEEPAAIAAAPSLALDLKRRGAKPPQLAFTTFAG